jgi:hypothetical protein
VPHIDGGRLETFWVVRHIARVCVVEVEVCVAEVEVCVAEVERCVAEVEVCVAEVEFEVEHCVAEVRVEGAVVAVARENWRYFDLRLHVVCITVVLYLCYIVALYLRYI